MNLSINENKPDYLIVNLGASSNYSQIASPLLNKEATIDGLVVVLPNYIIIKATNKGIINL